MASSIREIQNIVSGKKISANIQGLGEIDKIRKMLDELEKMLDDIKQLPATPESIEFIKKEFGGGRKFDFSITVTADDIIKG